MNYEKRYLIQKKRADLAEQKVKELENKILILHKENDAFAENQKIYDAAIANADKAKNEYKQLIEEVKTIKAKYKNSVQEFDKVKKKYAAEIKSLRKQIKKW